ncbi:MAG: helix-turn-helix domain-containing protein [Acidobacteriales bacterium]|nr:helix-turn-helix domain-containing protein [Terriglobales bacterium]
MSAQTQAPLWPEMEPKTEQSRRMGSFGERIQREREMRSITLEEISESTKISTRFLRALEEEQFSRLPGGIFNKGFVRAYARFLGIDEEQAVADFVAVEEQFNKEQEIKQPGAPGSNREVLAAMKAVSEVDPLESHPSNGFLVAAVILVSLLGIGGFVYKYLDSRPSPATISEPASSPAKSTAAPVQSPATQPSVSNGNGASSNPDTPVLTSEAASPDQLKAASPDVVAGIDTAGRPISLQIHARQPSWVQVTSDGKVIFAETLLANSQRNFQADKEMVVKLGNAAGVELVQNGKTLPAFPPQTTTRVLTFTAKNQPPSENN